MVSSGSKVVAKFMGEQNKQKGKRKGDALHQSSRVLKWIDASLKRSGQDGREYCNYKQ